MVKGGLLSFFLVFLWVLLQIGVFHLTKTRQLFKVLSLLFIFTLPAYAAIYLLTPPTLGFLPQTLTQGSPLLGFLNGFILHLLWYPTYVSCFYYVDRPLTLRILIAFLKAPDGRQALSQIKASYRLEYMIERRLQAMKDGGFVIEGEGKYFLTPKGKGMTRLFCLGRELLKIDRFPREK